MQWDDGTSSYYPIAWLRKMSPSADTRELRAEMARNPLTVLPSSMANQTGPLTATVAQFVGNYALRITFSDGHDTGIFSWAYLYDLGSRQQVHWDRYLRRLAEAGVDRDAPMVSGAASACGHGH